MFQCHSSFDTEQKKEKTWIAITSSFLLSGKSEENKNFPLFPAFFFKYCLAFIKLVLTKMYKEGNVLLLDHTGKLILRCSLKPSCTMNRFPGPRLTNCNTILRCQGKGYIYLCKLLCCFPACATTLKSHSDFVRRTPQKSKFAVCKT